MVECYGCGADGPGAFAFADTREVLCSTCIDGYARHYGLNEQGPPEGTPCRACAECEGYHHWLDCGASAEEVLDGCNAFRCKHCEATSDVVECSTCGEEVPEATCIICAAPGQSAVYTCSDCWAEVVPDEDAP